MLTAMFKSSATLIEYYINYLSKNDHFSISTVRCYTNDLKKFINFLLTRLTGDAGRGISDEGNDNMIQELVCGATQKTIPSFIKYLNNLGNSTSTIQRTLASISTFYNFLISKGEVETNPIKKAQKPKQKNTRPRGLTDEELNRLFSVIDTDKITGARDRAILETLYTSGITVSELVFLNRWDVDFLGEVIHVNNNIPSRQKRIAPIGTAAILSIQNYLNILKIDGMNYDQETPLFRNRFGCRIGTRSVTRLLDKHVNAAGLGPNISPCTLRHSFAYHMLNTGADLKVVQKLLGHKSISTTRKYVTGKNQSTIEAVGVCNTLW